MKILWLLRRSLLATWNGQLEWAVEKFLGEDKVAFYGDVNLPYRDDCGERYFPQSYNNLGTITEAVNEEKPDIIVVDMPIGIEEINTSNPKIGHSELSKFDIPKVAFMNDIHTEWSNRKIRVQTGQLDMVFVRSYGGGIGYRIKREICPVGYSPCFAATRIFYDMKELRTHHVYLSGCLNVIYPHRMNLLLASNQSNLKWIIDRKNFSSQTYRLWLNKSMILAFGTGMMKYPVLKIFEGMSSNTLTMFDLPYDYKALRFKPDENIVELPFSGSSALIKINQLINDGKERRRIIQNAAELVQNYHSADARAEQLIAQFEEVINAKNEGRIFDSRNVKGEAGIQLQILEETESQFNRNSLLNRCIDGGFPVLQQWYDEANAKWRAFSNGYISELAWKDFVIRNL